MTSPGANGKVPDGGMTDGLKDQNFVVKTSAHVGVFSMNQFALAKFQKQLEQHAKLTNMPQIGGMDNVYYPAIQLNIAPVVSGSKTKLLEGMGDSGCSHFDALPEMTSLA
ncbi:hypothetical protein DXG03_004163 [Asterophora parasitica]|uniref:Uncharacterized protein n=1 Tax=Asterophora parasitica TaxID=117018 RepID=A0A9P7FW09_9AGAR|nr:hypothetical protein DXG03_004163 [Asterophora parasitica]